MVKFPEHTPPGHVSQHTPPGHPGDPGGGNGGSTPPPPTQFNVYSFSVFLKSKLAAEPMGETVPVIAATAEEAQQAVTDNFGGDLIRATGPCHSFLNAYMAAAAASGGTSGGKSSSGSGSKGFLNVTPTPPLPSPPPQADQQSTPSADQHGKKHG